LRVRPPRSASSSRTKPRNGPGSSGRPTSRPIDAGAVWSAIPGICGSPWGNLAASILARRPTSRAIDPATKDCKDRAQIRIPAISIVLPVILFRHWTAESGTARPWRQLRSAFTLPSGWGDHFERPRKGNIVRKCAGHLPGVVIVSRHDRFVDPSRGSSGAWLSRILCGVRNLK
jgi:hypothetical protein